MFEQLTKLISTNQMASAGILTVITGTLLAYCRAIPGQIYRFLLNNFTTEVDLKLNTNVCNWVTHWFSENIQRKYGKYEVYEEQEKVKYTIAHGTYYRWYKWRPVIITKYRRKNGMTEEEWIFLRFLCSKKIVEEFFQEIQKQYKKQ